MILIYAAIAIVGLAVLGLALNRIQVNKKVRHNSKKHENNETMDVCRHPHTMRHNDNGL